MEVLKNEEEDFEWNMNFKIVHQNGIKNCLMEM